jgi:Fur family transcriptional regulator, ferric uptake regulator
MKASTNDLEAVLREHGYSITKQRLLIFSLFVDQAPMTMYELYDRAKEQMDRASTYRIVTLFEKLGIVQRINIGWKYKIELSDRFSEHHHHLACTSCGKIIPISEKELEQFIAMVAATHQFIPIAHQVEIQGLCRDCEAKKTRD